MMPKLLTDKQLDKMLYKHGSKSILVAYKDLRARVAELERELNRALDFCERRFGIRYKTADSVAERYDDQYGLLLWRISKLRQERTAEQSAKELGEIRELVLPNNPTGSHQELMEELRAMERHSDLHIEEGCPNLRADNNRLRAMFLKLWPSRNTFSPQRWLELTPEEKERVCAYGFIGLRARMEDLDTIANLLTAPCSMAGEKEEDKR